MATTALNKMKQIDWDGIALLVTDIVASGKVFANGVELSSTELGFVDGVTAGTTIASKAVVVDSSLNNTGINNLSITGDFTVDGAAGTGTATAGVIKLTTPETTVVITDQLGRIDFSAPLEASGTDAILVGASIWAEAGNTFDATTNDTDLVFATGLSEAAAEKMRIDGAGAITATGPIASTGGFNGAVNPLVLMTKGAGVSAMETYANGVVLTGTIKTTRIIIDLTGLVGSGTDVDIIGNTGGAASAHMGQVTAAINGTLVGGQVTCLEVPAGGTADINFYAATESTGAQDALASDLTETVLIDSGGAWTSGASKGMTALPPANSYLYVANGAASGGTFSAGKFLIELYGT